MKKKSLNLLMLIALPFFAFAQARLTSIDNRMSSNPNKFYTQSDNINIVLTINGENIWPDYMDINSVIARVKVIFRKGDKIQEVKKSAINKSSVDIHFMSDDWLTNITPVQVYIETDGVSSNSLAIIIIETPKTAPVINSISPVKFVTGQETGNYKFILNGKNFGEMRTTWVKVNGVEAHEALFNHLGGTLNTWIPHALINSPGTYQVQVITKYGSSNVVTLVIDKPLLKFAPVNATGLIPPKREPVNVTALRNPNTKLRVSDLKFIQGIQIKMQGDVYYEEEKSKLENYAMGLDGVFFVDNELNITKGASQVTITITSKGVEKVSLDHVKLSLEKKLTAMGINKTVTIK